MFFFDNPNINWTVHFAKLLVSLANEGMKSIYRSSVPKLIGIKHLFIQSSYERRSLKHDYHINYSCHSCSTSV